jgi:SAM-dependent methyltransferase
VLDFGCGFGSLVADLQRRGYEATGIDLLDFQIAEGEKRFPNADLRLVTPDEPLPFPDQAFDTVVFKESLHHLAAEGDIVGALREVGRVCRQRIVVFEPNPSVPLKIGRTLIAHVDPTLEPAAASAILRDAGFSPQPPVYLSSLALPLSGGYVGRRLVPRKTPAKPLLRIDDWLVRKLGAGAAWRYLLVADH